jgi:D-alanyl-D-alanine carboxypeptidase (penicillin-binding protein 5/6)
VLGVAHGAALEPGDDVWYRVSTGSYRPAFIYSAYLKFAHPGVSPVPLPLVGAAAALAVDMDSLRILYSRNATVPRPPASLAKMMTAAVALDHLGSNTVITVPPGAPSVGAAVGGTAMGLLPGERLSLHDLLYGMLLPSGNDAAYTIAQAVAGSQQAFAALMNAKAAALGLAGTHFVQGYGLDDPGQYSTAWDLTRLARYDLRHYALFDQIVATAYHDIGPGLTHPAFALHNLNRLLGVYPGAFGVKTGTTPAAGQNLVAAVRRDGRRIIVVVLGSSDRYADATALLNYAVAIDR